MRFFKILFKIILILVLVFTFAIEYDILNFDDGFKFAKFESRSELLSNSDLDIKTAKIDFFPIVNLYVVTAKEKNGQPHIVFDTKAHKQLQELQSGSKPSDADAKDLAYLAALAAINESGLNVGHNATHPLVYIVVLFGLLMIPTKKIRKPVNSRR